MQVYSKGHEKAFRSRKKLISKREENKRVSFKAKMIDRKVNYTNRQNIGWVLYTEKIVQKNNPINVCNDSMKLQTF